METTEVYRTRPPIPVGKILVEYFMKPYALTQTRLATHLGWTQPKLNDIIQGRRGLTTKTAMTLADAFGTSVGFWLNAQRAADIWKAQQTYHPVSLIKQSKIWTACIREAEMPELTRKLTATKRHHKSRRK